MSQTVAFLLMLCAAQSLPVSVSKRSLRKDLASPLRPADIWTQISVNILLVELCSCPFNIIINATSKCCSQLYFQRERRWVIRNTSRLWNGGKAGQIMYDMSKNWLMEMYTQNTTVFTNISFSTDEKGVIRRALKSFPFCGHFVEANSVSPNDYYIQFLPSYRSYVENLGKGKPRDVYLSIFSKPMKQTVIHEVMHALGFLHEHSRFDRDDYVRVHSFLQDRASYAKTSLDNYTAFGLPYDNRSISHYPEEAFEEVLHGQEVGGEVMSVLDILKLNRRYECDNQCTCHFNETIIVAVGHGVPNPQFCETLCQAKAAWRKGYTSIEEFAEQHQVACTESIEHIPGTDAINQTQPRRAEYRCKMGDA